MTTNAIHRRASEPPLTYEQLYRNLDGATALLTAEATPLKKLPDERDTAFVKRIVATFMAFEAKKFWTKSLRCPWTKDGKACTLPYREQGVLCQECPAFNRRLKFQSSEPTAVPTAGTSWK